MRISNRTRILEAIVDIVQRDGVTGLTFDAVAAETGLTRGGLLYHFPSREELIVAAHKHLADHWERGMEQIAGGTAASATAFERHAAYITTCAETAKRVELILMLESTNDPQLGALWQGVQDRWAPPVPEDDDAVALSRFIARLAADGLWIHEALSNRPLPAGMKQRIRDALVEMVDAGSAE